MSRSMRSKVLALAAASGGGTALPLVGCASLPNATLTYYLAQSTITVKVVRTVACDKLDNPIVVNSVTPSVVHTADLRAAKTLELHMLRGNFSDNDVKLELYEDGRIKGINATGAGQGETILKSALTLLSAVKEAPTRTFPKECGVIKSAGGDKALTLTYQSDVDISTVPSALKLVKAEQGSSYYERELAAMIGHVCASAVSSEKPEAPVSKASLDKKGVMLTVRQPGQVAIRVVTGRGESCSSPDEIWTGKVVAAQHGTEYRIAVPAPSAFGKMTTALAFSESGALNSVQYQSTSGAAQAIGVINSAMTAFQRDSVEQKVKEVKAEADLIQQQQRLATCLADRAACK